MVQVYIGPERGENSLATINMLRKKRLILIVLALLVSAALVLPATISYATRSDRERDGLSGPVRSIVWKATLVNQKSGVLTESDAYDVERVEYDKGGNRTRRQRFGMCDACSIPIWLSDFHGRVRIETYLSWPLTLFAHSYDIRGNRVETKYYDVFGNLWRRWIYQYEIDEHGNWTKETLSMIDTKFFNGDRTPVPREVYYRTISYD